MPGSATTSRRSACRCSASPTASTSRSAPRSCSTRRDDSAASRADHERGDHGHVRLRRSSAPDPPARPRPTRRASSGRRSRSIDRRWFGGSCPHIGCLPSKSLLDGAARHAREPGALSTGRTHRRRATTWSTGRRMPPSPTTRVTCARLREAGAVAYRGTATIAGQGRVTVSHDDSDARAGRRRTSSSRSGRSRSVPPIEGIDAIPTWTNREATLARELPASLLVLGGGPTGCELAQVYARFGVPTTIVQSGPRLAPTDHPRNSEVVRAALERDGVIVRTEVRALRARAGAGARRRARHRARRRLDRRGPRDPAGRRPVVPARRPRARALRHRHDRSHAVPARRPAAHRRRAVGHRRPGRPRAPHPPGPLPGRARRPDGARRGRRARLPGAAPGDVHRPGGVVGRADPRWRRCEAGLDAFELRRRLREERQGLRGPGQARPRHDRGRPRGRASSSARRWPARTRPPRSTSASLAIKAHVTVDVLAETIHAFPSTSRIFNGLFADALPRSSTATTATGDRSRIDG